MSILCSENLNYISIHHDLQEVICVYANSNAYFTQVLDNFTNLFECVSTKVYLTNVLNKTAQC